MDFKRILFLGVCGLFLVFSVQSCGKANPLRNQDLHTITDIDGNLYHTIKIGNQIWTVENFRSTKFNDGSKIPLVADSIGWTNLFSPGFCWRDENMSIRGKSGALYNWYAVNITNFAPPGWHVPTDSDWYILENYLITNGFNWNGKTDSNKIAKSLAAKTDWQEDTVLGTIGNDLSKNNNSGFTARPNSIRSPIGVFIGPGNEVFWWSTTVSINDSSAVCARYLAGLEEDLYKFYAFKKCGLAVRLLKD